VENKTGIRQHALKMQQISLLPKYIKLISRGVYLMCICVCEGRLSCNRPLTKVHYVYFHRFNFSSFLINYGQSTGLKCVSFYAQLGADLPNCQFELYLQQRNNFVNVQNITLMTLQINARSEFI